MSSPFPSGTLAKPAAAETFCPSCGAGTPADQKHCWLCYAPLAEPPVVAAVAFEPRLAAANSAQFSIATILLVTTLAAVVLGVFRLNVGLGVMLLVLAIPALVRTVYVGRREKRQGQRLSNPAKIGHFFLSLLIMYAVWTAGSTAFFVAVMGTCFAAMATSAASEEAAVGVGIAGLVLSVVAGLGVASVVVWATWPKRG